MRIPSPCTLCIAKIHSGQVAMTDLLIRQQLINTHKLNDYFNNQSISLELCGQGLSVSPCTCIHFEWFGRDRSWDLFHALTPISPAALQLLFEGVYPVTGRLIRILSKEFPKGYFERLQGLHVVNFLENDILETSQRSSLLLSGRHRYLSLVVIRGNVYSDTQSRRGVESQSNLIK